MEEKKKAHTNDVFNVVSLLIHSAVVLVISLQVSMYFCASSALISLVNASAAAKTRAMAPHSRPATERMLRSSAGASRRERSDEAARWKVDRVHSLARAATWSSTTASAATSVLGTMFGSDGVGLFDGNKSLMCFVLK